MHYFYENVPTETGKVAIYPKEFARLLDEALSSIGGEANKKYPFLLISRRKLQMMNSWMHESALKNNRDDTSGCYVEVNRQDCEKLQFTHGQEIVVKSETAELAANVKVSDQIRPGVVVMEQGWGGVRYKAGVNEVSEKVSGMNSNLLVSNNSLAPMSAVPQLNGSAVQLLPVFH